MHRKAVEIRIRLLYSPQEDEVKYSHLPTLSISYHSEVISLKPQQRTNKKTWCFLLILIYRYTFSVFFLGGKIPFNLSIDIRYHDLVCSDFSCLWSNSDWWYTTHFIPGKWNIKDSPHTFFVGRTTHLKEKEIIPFESNIQINSIKQVDVWTADQLGWLWHTEFSSAKIECFILICSYMFIPCNFRKKKHKQTISIS